MLHGREDAIMGRDVVLTGGQVVGNDCWLRPDSTIKQSVLLPGVCVGDGAYLEDCIVGHGYDVPPGGRIKGGALIRWSAATIFSTD
jgi:mannose-1-phosphate guanylyltransferase